MTHFFLTVFLLLTLFSSSCPERHDSNKIQGQNSPAPRQELNTENLTGTTIESRFQAPAGFFREKMPDSSFARYLRELPLKPAGAPVHLFNGDKKANQQAHAAVIDLDTGDRDLQQCADAVMRLRAEYLFAQKKYEEIQFHFVNGFLADYQQWRKGMRIAVNGNNVKWVVSNRESTSYESFRNYLNMVFAYAGTPSLQKELIPVNAGNMEIGDVFIQGGSPGHAVIVVDMAVHHQTGRKVFLLAQSYMPAQDIHILKNPANKTISPWYELDFGAKLETPEWLFSREDLRRFATWPR